jgi:hypothetical protein
MVKYTLFNDLYYILFDGIVGTPTEGESFAFRKSSIKRVVTLDSVDMINLYHLDDTDSPFIYYELVNPLTGLPFLSLDACRNVFMLWLNDLALIGDPFLGGWDASTNIPIIADNGYWDGNNTSVPDVLALPKSYFIVTISGNTLIDGENGWQAGDLIKSTGSVWVRIPSTGYVSATHVFVDVAGMTDPAWALITNAQQAFNLIESTAVKVLSDLADVDPALAPVDKALLTFNQMSGLWEAVVPQGGRTLLHAKAILDGTSALLPAFGDGLYILDKGLTAPWVPVGALIGDVLSRAVNNFTVYKVMSLETAGSYEVQYSAGKFVNSNYVWDGTVWSAIDAYEPNATLLTVNVSNPLGDVTSSSIGSDLKSRSISSLLDDILFETIYTAPTIPTLTLTGGGGDIERGDTIVNNIVTPVFVQNGGGAVVDWKIEALDNGVVVATETGLGPVLPAANALDVDGYTLIATYLAGNTAQIRYTVNYSAGTIPTDNKGITYPVDQILSGTVVATTSWTSRYPIFWGSEASAYGVAIGNRTDLSVPPILVESNIRALDHTILFTIPGIQSDTITTNDITILVALPPGITMSLAEINVGGSWFIWDHLKTNYTTVSIKPADGSSGGLQRDYRVHYARSISNTTFTQDQEYRFTTIGTVTP